MFKKLDDPNKINLPEKDYLYTNLSQIPNSGKGLFTAITIYKDEIIAVYKGRIVSEVEAKAIADNKKDAYFINLLDGSIMDSRRATCLAKYANDASGFSVSEYTNNTIIGLDEKGNVCLIARRKIIAGSEIFCSYGKRYWKKRVV
jgi:uncharacterized protein